MDWMTKAFSFNWQQGKDIFVSLQNIWTSCLTHPTAYPVVMSGTAAQA